MKALGIQPALRGSAESSQAAASLLSACLVPVSPVLVPAPSVLVHASFVLAEYPALRPLQSNNIIERGVSHFLPTA